MMTALFFGPLSMRAAVLLLTLVLAACATVPPASDRVLVAPGVTLALPAPGELGRREDAVQLVTARRDGETFVFECRLSVDGERLLLAGSDSMGRRAMTVTWSRDGIVVERADWLPETLKPENVLADIVLLYWPEEAVRRGLSGAPLIQTPQGRSVGDSIVVSWRGDPWNGLSRLVNRPWGYEIEVRSARVAP